MSVDLKREEALLNEYKGNLFEFLVGSSLARLVGNELQFLKELSPSMQQMLGHQESFLRKFHPELLNELPVLALGMATEIISHFTLRPSFQVLLVGKSLAATSNSEFGEADIILIGEDQKYPISLKLSKSHAYVNTKSAGIRTVLSKYFECKLARELQDELNHFCDIEFEGLARQMHEEAGIEFTDGFKNWEKLGLEQLPGQLEPRFRSLLLAYYEKANTKLFQSFMTLSNKHELSFKKGLYSLLGFSSSQIIQATAQYNAHTKAKTGAIVGHGYIIETPPKIIKGYFLENRFKQNSTNFEICLPEKSLQIRIKPMNKFTSKAFKINCSVRKRS